MKNVDRTIKLLTVSFAIVVGMLLTSKVFSSQAPDSGGFELALLLLIIAPVLIVGAVLGISSVLRKNKSIDTDKTDYGSSKSLIILGVLLSATVYLLILI
jgi:hypothetical protein